MTLGVDGGPTNVRIEIIVLQKIYSFFKQRHDACKMEKSNVKPLFWFCLQNFLKN